MKKRASRKSTAASLLVSPLPAATPQSASPSAPVDSPKPFIFDLNSSSKASRKPVQSASKSMEALRSPPSQKTLRSTSDLRQWTSSSLDSLKRHLDCSHSEIIRDAEASQSRIHKRFKIQSQACQQVMDEAEKEYKKMSERISENQEAMKASYTEFMAEAQASASRVCKTSIPEISQSFKKAIDVLQNRFGIPSTAV
ncbi:uncharacterized protein LOC131155011 [Malania oleifera]|uniref:uncharacterized protein LOC131155011 n=1 Tax=Malania oleifera TaxID=397392 RepID=UPI0025AE180C|nr:uncharacterized protein LOC131155011 [Malania oleifera]